MLIPTGTAGHRSLSRSAANRLRNRVRAVVVETKPIDQRLLRGQSKNTWLRVSWLRFCGHGADLDKTEPERCPRGKSNTVFVQASGKSNWVWEVETKECFWFRRRLKRFEHAQREIEMRRPVGATRW